VDDCIAWSGARPVEYLLAHAPIDRRWCIIHATHLTRDETVRLALSGATVGLCPITEANLGDGVFNATTFLTQGGHIGIGTDSNIVIGVADELRQLEYAQRLQRNERNVLGDSRRSTGRALLENALAGAPAIGPSAALAVGAPADFLSLRRDHPMTVGSEPENVLDIWVFVDSRLVDAVWVGGERLVEKGRHRAREKIEARFRAVAEILRR
jgi:formimidoylglutamate deiminase